MSVIRDTMTCHRFPKPEKSFILKHMVDNHCNWNMHFPVSMVWESTILPKYQEYLGIKHTSIMLMENSCTTLDVQYGCLMPLYQTPLWHPKWCRILSINQIMNTIYWNPKTISPQPKGKTSMAYIGKVTFASSTHFTP